MSSAPGGRRLRTHTLLLLAFGALLSLGALEITRSLRADAAYPQKLAAARKTALAAEALKAERIALGIPIDRRLDPNETGLIGPEHSPITTTLGSLPAKRTATDPNMAGMAVEMLARTGVRPGDCAAVSFSGSFPALNIAVLSALEAVGARAAIVSSVGASGYGASHPDFTWPDMERFLHDRGFFRSRSAAVSPGGVVSIPSVFGEEGIRLARAAIERTGLPALPEEGGETLIADVERRFTLYENVCGGKPSVFINVGGNLTSLGLSPEAGRLPSGVLPPDLRSAHPARGMLFRMLETGVPAIHLLDIQKLAREYGLPVDPVPLPAVPHGRVMTRGAYSRSAALAGLLLLAVLGTAAERKRLRKYLLQKDREGV
jgi:poly-gamma-glutamate system protein